MKSQELTIYGRIPVLETLRQHSHLIKRVVVMGSIEQQKAEEVRDLASLVKVPIEIVSKEIFKKQVPDEENINHQGVIAVLSEFPYEELHSFVEKLDLDKNPALLLLDEIQDTHNVGAILRTAAASGVSAVLLPEHRQAPVNSTVFKTSAGMALNVPIIKIGNINQTLEMLKNMGFWSYALVQEGTTSLYDLVIDSPSVFVVGSEGGGVRQRTLEICDYHISIPMQSGVESLNASVSAALVMYEWARKSRL